MSCPTQGTAAPPLTGVIAMVIPTPGKSPVSNPVNLLERKSLCQCVACEQARVEFLHRKTSPNRRRIRRKENAVLGHHRSQLHSIFGLDCGEPTVHEGVQWTQTSASLPHPERTAASRVGKPLRLFFGVDQVAVSCPMSGDHLLRQLVWHVVVMRELHRVRRAPLRLGGQVGGVREHLG
jgi:hypothetical protein